MGRKDSNKQTKTKFVICCSCDWRFKFLNIQIDDISPQGTILDKAPETCQNLKALQDQRLYMPHEKVLSDMEGQMIKLAILGLQEK